MLTLFRATHTLTQELTVLFAALAALLLGIALFAAGAIRRGRQRHEEEEGPPIDTARFRSLKAPPPGEELFPGFISAEAAVAEMFGQNGESPAPPAAEPMPEPPPAPEPAAAQQPVIAAPPSPAFTGAPAVLVCTGYGAGFGGRIILSGVTLDVPEQGVTTLMGPPQTGKSTLLRALSGALGQSGLFREWGHAWFRGAPLGPDNRPMLVTQRIQLVQRSALENLLFHLQGRTADLAMEARRGWAERWLTEAGAAPLIAALDQPFMTLDPLGQRIITVLREAAAMPALLLIDEPTAGLAEADAAQLLAVLERLAGFTPLLLALQNQKHARRISDRIVLLAGGRVQAACGRDEFFDTPPNPLVAQFIATGTCATAPPEAADIPPAEIPMPGPPPAPPSAESLAAIKQEIRLALAPELMPLPTMQTAPEEQIPAPESAQEMDAPVRPEPLPESLAAEAEPPPEPEPAAFAPASAPEPGPPVQDEVITPERVTGPIARGPAGPVLIEILPDDPDDEADADLPFDDLPPISLGAQMIQPAPAAPDPAPAPPAPPAGPPGFVWVEPGRLAATPLPGLGGLADTDLAALREAGITMLITLTEQDYPQSALTRHGLHNLHFPIAETTAPGTAQAEALIGQMHALLARGEVLAVHGLRGAGRTGTMLAAYLIKENGLSAQAALEHIRRLGGQFAGSLEQEDFLVEFEVQQEQQALLLHRAGARQR